MSFIIPFTTEKTGVHDLIFDTRVRKKDISKKLFFPATILTIALYVLNSHLYTLAEDHIDSYISSELTKIDKKDISQLTNKLSTFEKEVNSTTLPKTKNIPDKQQIPPPPLTNGQIGVMRVGDRLMNYKDVFVKVVDIHNQGLKQKIAPSNYELQIALYDKVLSAQEKEHLKKVDNLIMATKNADMTFAIQLANIENGCLESNFRNAKIQIKKGANDFSLALTPYNLFKKGRLSITCTDFNKETPLTFSLRNTFYRSHDREVKLNLKFTTMIE